MAAKRHPSEALLRPGLTGLIGPDRASLWLLIVLSCLINLLMLTGPIFMMQVYDRVLASQSLITLMILGAMVAVLYAVQAGMDAIRSRVTIRLAARTDQKLAPLAFAMAAQRGRLKTRQGDGQQPLRDLDTLRQFRAGGGPMVLLDLPWTPIYLVIISLFHPVLGGVAVAGASVLFALTLAADRMSGAAGQTAAQRMAERNAEAEAGVVDSDTLEALGILDRLGETWAKAHGAMVRAQVTLADRAGGLQAAAKGFRFLLQSLTLAVGAWLVIRGELSAGSMMATSVLSSRALAPIEGAISHWRSALTARSAAERLRQSLALLPTPEKGINLAPPKQSLQLNNLSVAPPGEMKPLLSGVTLTLTAGQGLGVIGPSGAGKTTLLRGLLGLWPVPAGSVRLDGATPDQWGRGLAGFTGYLPQDTRLLPGTIAQNIARFDPEATTEAITAAAEMAGVHELILNLPGGYNAPVGANGLALSAGQRQRVALARAVYGQPFLVVMDEPNANLDAEGDAALTACIARLRAAGAIVICVSHRPAALASLDQVLMLEAGRMRSFGPRDEVLGQVTRYPRAVSSSV